MSNNIEENIPRILNTTNPDLQRFSDDLAAIEHFLSEIEKTETEFPIKPFFLSTKEVARILNLSIRTLISYRDKGIIPYVRIGGTILYPIDKLKEYLNSHIVIPEVESNDKDEKGEKNNPHSVINQKHSNSHE